MSLGLTDYDVEPDDFHSEADIISSTKLSDDKKREVVSLRFARTASNGDVRALERMWDVCRGSQWVNIDHRDDQGSTPLICASCFGHTHIAELLLEYGANVDSQDNSGWTALMWATSTHNEGLVRVLLEQGASPSTKTARGHTAINIASSNLASGSDSESGQRPSASPGQGSDTTELVDGVATRLSGAGYAESESASIDARGGGGSEPASFKAGGENDSLSVGSPQSLANSAGGTPRRRAHGRESFTAGQSVLSMLQASSARSSVKLSGTCDTIPPEHDHGLLSPTRSTEGCRATNEGLGLSFGDELAQASATADLVSRMRGMSVGQHDLGDEGNNDDDDESEGDDETQAFDWDTLQLDQMYVISPATVPQFLHAIVKDIRPERWIQSAVKPEHRFVPASMIFLAARFAHHLGTPDFLDSFLSDTIASVIHEVQTHKADPVCLAFWLSNIHTLIYFFKRDSTLVQITSEAQGRMSECMHDAYALLVRAIQAEIEPLLDPSLLAYESMPELFADVKFEAEKSQRLSMFFFGGQAESTRKSADGRPLRRSQTVLQKGGRPRGSSFLGSAPKKSDSSGPATAAGEMPAWVVTVQQLKGIAVEDPSRASLSKRASSGDTFVSGRSSTDNARPSVSLAALFSSPTPRTVTFMLESLLDLLDMCEVHPHIAWNAMRQVFCYMGSEAFNRVLTTRDFCSRSRAMQIRMNLSQISDWVRSNAHRLHASHATGSADHAETGPSLKKSEGTPTADSLLFQAYFDPLIELLELLQCLTHLPDLAEYFETTAKMQNLNILQQETAATNYRYEVQESRVAADVLEYLESIAKEIRDGQRAEREKQSIEKASRRSSASVFSERRTMDGRPSLLSLDLTSSSSRTASGMVRVLADPAAQQPGGAPDHSTLPERAAGGIALSRTSAEGGASSQAAAAVAAAPAGAGSSTVSSRHRAGTRTGRRGLLIPIARPGATGARASVRNLFPSGQQQTSGRTSTSSRISESLEPISEASSVISRQRSRTTIDSADVPHSDASSMGAQSKHRFSDDMADAFTSASLQHQQAPPVTAPADATWTQSPERSEHGNSDEALSASLRGPRGKKCLPENMKELLDSGELLSFAVPTSREWLSWWQSSPADAAAAAPKGDWSNDTVAQPQQAGETRARPELAPAVPSEFLNALSQIA
ncbi:hypothetical protein GGF46_000225 [Coemansia sp. RSA 552]|nr:hypothetical protein GGF46_000225 [Coemansia sp. RSA 552]